MKTLSYREDEGGGIEYVTFKMITDKFGEKWANKWSVAAGPGNTMIAVEEDGKLVGGIYIHDWERFRDLVDKRKPTFFD